MTLCARGQFSSPKLDSFINLSHIREILSDVLPKSLRKTPFSFSMNTNIVLRKIKALASHDSRLSINELRVIIALERAVARFEHEPLLAEHLALRAAWCFSSRSRAYDLHAMLMN